MLDFGWAPLDGVLAGREKYIELPMPELYDLARRSRRDATNLVDRAGRARRACWPRGSPNSTRRCPARRSRKIAGGDRAAARARLRVGIGAAPKARYTEQDDPKRLVEIDRLMHDAVALDEEGAAGDAIARYREILARRPEMMAASRHLAFDLLARRRLPARDRHAARGDRAPADARRPDPARHLPRRSRTARREAIDAAGAGGARPSRPSTR